MRGTGEAGRILGTSGLRVDASFKMRHLLTSRAKEKAAEQALSEQLIPGAYKKFIPEFDTVLVVTFPGETIRCPVKKVISTDAVLIHVSTPPMTKGHSFDFDKMYGARRRMRDGRDFWEAQKDQEFLAEQFRDLKPK